MGFRLDLPEFDNKKVSTIEDVSDDIFETYYESTLIKEIRTLILSFEIEENIHERNYFQDKLKRIVDYYKEFLKHNDKIDSNLKEELFQSLLKEFGEEKAKKQIDEFVFKFSNKEETYKNYLVLLEMLLDEIKLHRKLNIKPVIDSIINSNVSSQEKAQKLIEVKNQFIENFNLYKTNERDDILNYLYGKIYDFLVSEINSGDLSFYNLLTNEDKTHLKEHFIRELNLNKFGKEKTRYFFTKLASLDSDGFDLSILKEYLSTEVVEEDDTIYIPSTEEREREIAKYLEEKRERDRLRTSKQVPDDKTSKPMSYKRDIDKTSLERRHEIEEYLKEKRERDKSRGLVVEENPVYSRPNTEKTYWERNQEKRKETNKPQYTSMDAPVSDPARFSYLSSYALEKLRAKAELYLYIETKRRLARARGQKVDTSDMTIEVPNIFTDEEWNSLDEKEKKERYMDEILEQTRRRSSYR